MKKTIAASILSLTALALSPLASAAEPAASGAMQLTADEMDGVTAGRHSRAPRISFHPVVANQTNNSTTTILQIGNNNIAIVFNGNIFIYR